MSALGLGLCTAYLVFKNQLASCTVQRITL
nr:MAG TPA: hypothetical protein [Caudoviricetes sp.]